MNIFENDEVIISRDSNRRGEPIVVKLKQNREVCAIISPTANSFNVIAGLGNEMVIQNSQAVIRKEEDVQRLREIEAVAKEILEPMLTANDGGAMWCAFSRDNTQNMPEARAKELFKKFRELTK